MRFRSPVGWLLGLVSMLLATLSCAQPSTFDDAGPRWMLGLGAQADEDENDSVLGTLYVGVGDRTWLNFAAGRSTSPAERADIQADILSIGVDHRFEDVGFTLAAEQWGDSGVLETQDWAGSVYFDRDRWRIGFGYEARDIEIPVTVTGPLGNTFQRTVAVGADRLSFDVRIGLGESWQLYGGFAEHDYERNLNVLPRIATLNLLSTSTLTLANSFLDHERYVAVEREFGVVSLNVRVATDRSAIDDSKFDSVDAAVLFPIGSRVDLEVNLGNGRSDFFDAGAYGGLLFLIYGR